MHPDDGFAGEAVDEAVFTPDGHLTEGGAHAFVDGALDDADAARTIAHVAGCARCAGVVAEARGLTAAATRVLGALDDVPAGVVPNAAGAAAAATAEPTPPAAAVADLAARRATPRSRTRWTGWPARAAATLLLAAGVGGTAWRAAREGTGSRPEAAMMASDTAAVSVEASAPAAGAAAAPPALGSLDAATAADRAASERPAPSAAPATSPAVSRDLPPAAYEAGAPRERQPRAVPNAPMQLATADSVPAAERSYAPAPPPAPEPAPPPPPPASSAVAASGAPALAAPRAAARLRVRVDTASERERGGAATGALSKDVASLAPAAPGAVPGCFVLGGAPRADGVALPVRVTLDSAGHVTPAVDGLTARWAAAGDSLRLTWDKRVAPSARRRRAPRPDTRPDTRLDLRLGPPDADGARRGTAVAADGSAAPASARPVRCDGGLP